MVKWSGRKMRAVVMAAVAFSLVWTIAPAAPAQAHDRVSEQSPAADEWCEIAPDAVTLTFTEEPLALGAIVVIVDAEDGDWAIGEPRIEGRTVTQAVAAGMPDGHYQVRWRVVSSDGHPTSESFLFSVGDTSTSAEITVPQTMGASPSGPVKAAASETLPTATPDYLRPGSPARAYAVAAVGALLALTIYWVVFIRPAHSLPKTRKLE